MVARSFPLPPVPLASTVTPASNAEAPAGATASSAAAAEIQRLALRGMLSKDPWRTTPVGGEFVIDKVTRYVSRTAAYYRKQHGLEFTCKALPGGRTLVRRLA